MRFSIFQFLRILAYTIVGFVIIFGAKLYLSSLLDVLNLIVGISLLYGSVTSFMLSIRRKAYKNEDNHVATHALIIIFSIIILISKYLFKDNSFIIICTLWGVAAIVSGSVRLNATLYEISEKKFKGLEVIETIESIVEIILAITLILDPQSHVETHLILLGASNVLFALILLVHEIKMRIQFKKVLNK